MIFLLASLACSTQYFVLGANSPEGLNDKYDVPLSNFLCIEKGYNNLESHVTDTDLYIVLAGNCTKYVKMCFIPNVTNISLFRGSDKSDVFLDVSNFNLEQLSVNAVGVDLKLCYGVNEVEKLTLNSLSLKNNSTIGNIPNKIYLNVMTLDINTLYKFLHFHDDVSIFVDNYNFVLEPGDTFNELEIFCINPFHSDRVTNINFYLNDNNTYFYFLSNILYFASKEGINGFNFIGFYIRYDICNISIYDNVENSIINYNFHDSEKNFETKRFTLNYFQNGYDSTMEIGSEGNVVFKTIQANKITFKCENDIDIGKLLSQNDNKITIYSSNDITISLSHEPTSDIDLIGKAKLNNIDLSNFIKMNISNLVFPELNDFSQKSLTIMVSNENNYIFTTINTDSADFKNESVNLIPFPLKDINLNLLQDTKVFSFCTKENINQISDYFHVSNSGDFAPVGFSTNYFSFSKVVNETTNCLDIVYKCPQDSFFVYIQATESNLTKYFINDNYRGKILQINISECDNDVFIELYDRMFINTILNFSSENELKKIHVIEKRNLDSQRNTKLYFNNLNITFNINEPHYEVLLLAGSSVFGSNYNFSDIQKLSYSFDNCLNNYPNNIQNHFYGCKNVSIYSITATKIVYNKDNWMLCDILNQCGKNLTISSRELSNPDIYFFFDVGVNNLTLYKNQDDYIPLKISTEIFQTDLYYSENFVRLKGFDIDEEFFNELFYFNLNIRNFGKNAKEPATVILSNEKMVLNITTDSGYVPIYIERFPQKCEVNGAPSIVGYNNNNKNKGISEPIIFTNPFTIKESETNITFFRVLNITSSNIIFNNCIINSTSFLYSMNPIGTNRIIN